MKTKPEFRRKILGVRDCESYKCQVPVYGLDCGDCGTLSRHMNRAHTELVASSQKAEVPSLQQRTRDEVTATGEITTQRKELPCRQ